MRVAVITGGIGAGKSTVADFLRCEGAVIIDADAVAASLLTAGSALLARVAEEFGPDVLLADRSLDRAALARVAFATRESAARLDALTHPAVNRALRVLADAARAATRCKAHRTHGR